MDALFDRGDDVPEQVPESPAPVAKAKPDEQTEIPWLDVEPEIDTTGYPSERAWVHDPKCKCLVCLVEKARLLRIRREQYAAPCEADRKTVAERVKYYRSRALRKLPLFERGPREKK